MNENGLHQHNPNIIAWWSAALPGFGQISQGKFINGILIIVWEFITNAYSHINEAIVYTFTGQFKLAKDVLNPRFFLLYITVFLFTIWDSRNTAIEMNELNVLSEREGAYISTPLVHSGPEMDYLAKRSPVKALIWSLFCPGLGHLYINRIIPGFFILFLYILSIYNSHILCAVTPLLEGDFAGSTHLISKQWFLFFPSLYAFSMFSSYTKASEYTKLFKYEKAHYYKQEYGFKSKDFIEMWDRV